jgi:uncharacterized protein YukE
MSSPIIQVNFGMLLQAADNLKARSADFQQHMGQADQMAKPLKQSWVESDSVAGEAYQNTWVQIVNGAVELSGTIDRLSRAVGQAKDMQEQQERTLAGRFPSGGGR